jgi:negative regulator of sigma E activity
MISSFASRNVVASVGNWTSSILATVSTWARTMGPVGWAKMVRIAAATMSV